jgi:hypothetical protein
MSDAAPQPGTPLHGPGGLLGTPGLGSRRARKNRKWGMRLKAKQIVGNLYRGDTGKFQAGSGGTPAGAKPQRGFVLSKQPKPTARAPIKTAKPKKGGGKGGGAAKKPKKVAQTAEQKRLARITEHAQNRQKILSGMNIAPDGQAALGDLADGEQPRDPSAVQRGGLVEAGLVEQARDGSYRLSASGRAAMTAAASGDAGRTGAIISSARDRTTARTERQQAAAERKRAADAKRAAAAAAAKKKPAAGGGGGGGGGGSANHQAADIARSARQEAADAARSARQQATAERRRQVEARRAAAVADRQAKQQRVLDRLKRQAQAGTKLTQAQRNQLTDAGMADESSGMWRVKAEAYGGIKRSNLDDGVFAGPDRSFPIKTAQDVKDAVRSLGRTKHDKAAVKKGIIRRARAIGAMDALPEDWRTKSFVVFKDHSGQHRWIARTTTAYRDRDGEIISEAALDADSQRMMASGQFGPLRYWHIGQPDPANLEAPWGPGIDIGDCDYSVVIGRTRIESGTFRSAAIATKMARVADRHEMSPGFLYTPEQPDDNGVFSAIRTFERSPVPRRFARASNLFTGFTVKEHTMELAEMERRFKAMYQELGLTPEQGLELGKQLLTTEKDAHAQQIAFKEATLAPPEEITIGGVVYTVKAAAPAMVEGSPEEEAAETPEEETAEMDAGEGDSGDMQGDYLGDMSWDEFAAKLGALLAPVLKMQDMVKSIGDAHAELKGMYGGVAQKDDARAAEVVAIKSQIATLAQKLAQIEGDQPATILPDDVAQALKSAGPQAPPDPNAPDVPNDPSRPYAAIAARTMPALYRTDAGGGFAGWTPPPPAQ